MSLFSNLTNKSIRLPAIVADWTDTWTLSLNSRLAQSTGRDFQKGYLTPLAKQKPANESRYGKNKNIDTAKFMK